MSALLVIREMQTETTVRYYYISTRMAEVKNGDNTRILMRMLRNWITYAFLVGI